MDVQEERRYIQAQIESYELQLRLIEEQLAALRQMNPRARGVASLIAQDERTLAGHRAGLAERRARLAELDALREDARNRLLDGTWRPAMRPVPPLLREAPTAEVALALAVDALRAERALEPEDFFRADGLFATEAELRAVIAAEAEARDQAAHQATRDRDREPDRWPTHRRPTEQRPPWYLRREADWAAGVREALAEDCPF